MKPWRVTLRSTRVLNREETYACGGGRFAKFGVGRRQWQIKPIRKREVRRIVIREVVGLCKDGQFEDFGGRPLRGLNRKGPQSSKEAANLIKCDPLATVGHQQAVADAV
jgi:hypothetical protein